MEFTARGLTQKKAGFPCSGLNLGSCFMSQDDWMSESCVDLIPRILLNSKANFKQAPEEEPSLTNRYVRVPLNFLPQVEWIPRFPD